MTGDTVNEGWVRMRIPHADKAEARAWAKELRVSMSQFIREAVRDRCHDLNRKKAQCELGELFDYVKSTGDSRALRDGASVRMGDSNESSTT